MPSGGSWERRVGITLRDLEQNHNGFGQFLLQPPTAECMEQCGRGAAPEGSIPHIKGNPELLFHHVCVRTDRCHIRAGVGDERVPKRHEQHGTIDRRNGVAFVVVVVSATPVVDGAAAADGSIVPEEQPAANIATAINSTVVCLMSYPFGIPVLQSVFANDQKRT